MNPIDAIKNLREKVEETAQNIINATPAKEIEQHIKGFVNQQFQKMNLVTREEFDVQTKVLERTREKVEALEAKVEQIEIQIQGIIGK
jgi:ubiquinone biosynthesis accessory factor UbiK